MPSGVTIEDAFFMEQQQQQIPKCPVCVQKIGTHGGPTSLACGHNGCLECFQQIQLNSVNPLCPLCRTPFGLELNLGTNNELKDALGRLELASHKGMPENIDSVSYPHDELIEQNYHPVAFDTFNTWTPGIAPVEYHIGTANNNSKLYDRREAVNVQPDQSIYNLTRGMMSMMAKKMLPAVENVEGLNGEQDVWASVHLPSAPPLNEPPDEETMLLRSVLDAEPPQWIPDSACGRCMQCNATFQPLTRGRHHCRFCGGIFCHACSKRKFLLPPKFMERNPQRVCGACCEKLEPVQDFLIGTISNAAQIAIHDVTDPSCMRGWINNPIGWCMEDEIYKATNTLRNFYKVGILKPEQSIPAAILRGAKGLAILTVIKAGMVLTYKVGTGLLIARRDDGSWSPPAAIMSFGLGWGLQMGGELVNFIIVLRSTKAVKAFSSRMHLSMGAGLSASAGPLGRLAEADLRVGDKGATACYTYSCSQGAFVGVSFEGNIVAACNDINARFYGDEYMTPEHILFGPNPLPRAATPLYAALHDLFFSVGV